MYEAEIAATERAIYQLTRLRNNQPLVDRGEYDAIMRALHNDRMALTDADRDLDAFARVADFFARRIAMSEGKPVAPTPAQPSTTVAPALLAPPLPLAASGAVLDGGPSLVAPMVRDATRVRELCANASQWGQAEYAALIVSERDRAALADMGIRLDDPLSFVPNGEGEGDAPQWTCNSERVATMFRTFGALVDAPLFVHRLFTAWRAALVVAEEGARVVSGPPLDRPFTVPAVMDYDFTEDEIACFEGAGPELWLANDARYARWAWLVNVLGWPAFVDMATTKAPKRRRSWLPGLAAGARKGVGVVHAAAPALGLRAFIDAWSLGQVADLPTVLAEHDELREQLGISLAADAWMTMDRTVADAACNGVGIDPAVAGDLVPAFLDAVAGTLAVVRAGNRGAASRYA